LTLRTPLRTPMKRCLLALCACLLAPIHYSAQAQDRSAQKKSHAKPARVHKVIPHREPRQKKQAAPVQQGDRTFQEKKK
jgi:hypothetical protein